MHILDKAAIREILLREFNQKAVDVDGLLKKFGPIHDDLYSAVQQWLVDRTISEQAFHGLTISEVMRKQRCHFLWAVFYLNRLYDPDLTPEARQALVQSLQQSLILW